MSDSRGTAMGKVLVQSLDFAYNKGRADARVEIEKAVDNIPIRIRQHIELIPKAAVMSIIHELDSYSDAEKP